MLRQILLASSTLAVLTMPAMAQDAAPDATRDSVVATVDGTDITLGELIAATSHLPAEYRQLPPELLFENMVAQLVQQQLLADTLTDTPARVEISLLNERRSLLAAEAIGDFLPDAISDEAVQAIYDEHFNADTAQTEYDADHILVATEDEAIAIIDRLDGGEDFADLARELSTDAGSGANGGDLGWFAADMMVEPFAVAVQEMEPGTLSEPIESQFGWHVILLNDTRMQELPPLDAIRPQIEEQLQQEAITARLEELQASATITLPEADAFDPALMYDLDLLND